MREGGGRIIVRNGEGGGRNSITWVKALRRRYD